MHHTSRTDTIYRVEVFSSDNWSSVAETDDRLKAESYLANIAERLHGSQSARILRETRTTICDYDLMKLIDA